MLVAIRIAAMKESLENIGRFDPQRARERLIENFRPADTTLVLLDETIIGFYALLRSEGIIKVEHFYILPAYQSRGIGKVVLDAIKKDARKSSCKIILSALKESKSNQFYTANGFILYEEEPFDNLYHWKNQQA